MDADAVYAELVKGGQPAVPAELAGRLADLARKATTSANVDDRLGAARVAAALPPKHSVGVSLALTRDPDLRVRRRALNAGRAAGPEGQVVLRRMMGDADEQIAAYALDWLTLAVDAAAAGAARDLLADPRPAIRARAVALVGVGGGPGMQIDLRRLVSDPDPAVKAAVATALARLSGREPKPERAIWWNLAAVSEDPEKDPPLPALAAPAPAVEAAPPVAAEAPATDPVAPEPTPAAADTKPAVPPGLGDQLRALGTAAPAERGPLVDALKAAPQAELQGQLGRYRAGQEPAFGVGLARMVLALDRGVWVTRLQSMLADPDPGVRAATCEAVAGLGGLSCVPWLTGLLRDPAEPVVVAAAEGLAAMGIRLGRPDLARQWLPQLRTDARPAVREAAEAALAKVAK